MKKTNNRFSSIVNFFDKYIINPFGKFLIVVKEKIKIISEKLDVLWSKKSSVIVLSLICALLLFFVIDKRIVVLSESNAEVLYGQKVKALYNEEEYIVEGLPKKVDITLIGKRWDIYLAKQYPSKEVTVDLKNLKPGTHKVKLKYEQVLKGVNYRIDPSEVTVTIRNKVSDKRALTAEIINKDKNTKPDDISIIMLDDNSEIYKYIDSLSYQIKTTFNWAVNRGYETKQKIENTLYISNPNNIKGLEFPYVICVTGGIQNTYKYRNILYTMLTRSFIQSYLLLKPTENLEEIEEGLSIINERKYIRTIEPTEEEKEKIQEKIIDFEKEHSLSYEDFLNVIFDELKIAKESRKRIKNALKDSNIEKFDRDKTISFIQKIKDFY